MGFYKISEKKTAKIPPGAEYAARMPGKNGSVHFPTYYVQKKHNLFKFASSIFPENAVL